MAVDYITMAVEVLSPIKYSLKRIHQAVMEAVFATEVVSLRSVVVKLRRIDPAVMAAAFIPLLI